MAQTNDNSGIGVILGVILAIVIAIGAYFFIKSEGGLEGAQTTNIELPDVNVDAPEVAPSAGDNDGAPAPAQQ